MKNHETDNELATIKAAIDAAWDDGCPVAGRSEELAELALRCWHSAQRRRIDQSNTEARTRDLVEGLIHGREADPKLAGPLKRDYEYLASKIAEALHKPH